MKMLFFLATCSLTVASCGQPAPENGLPLANGPTGKIDTYFSRLEPFGLCGTFLVAEGDSILYHKAFGMADRENGLPNTTETLYSLGSITKQFTAAAILKLELEGKLTTKDSLSQFFDNVPSDKRGITLHHLLTHTSGTLLNVKSTNDFVETTKAEMLDLLFQKPLLFEPGTAFQYSNAGYSLLAAVIEQASDLTYEQYVNQHLFQPAGMAHTGYELAAWNGLTEAHNYVDEKDYGTFQSRNFVNWNLMGNGALLTTTGDMFRWYRALSNGTILSSAAKKKLFTPFLNDYAYGWEVYDNGEIIEHTGGGAGNNSLFLWYPKADWVFIGLSNCALDGWDMLDYLYDDLEYFVYDEPVSFAPDITPTKSIDLSQYAGTYALPSGETLELLSMHNGLKIRANSQEGINLLDFNDRYQPDLFHEHNQLALEIFRRAIEEGDYSGFFELLEDTSKVERIRTLIENQVADPAFQQPRVQPYRTEENADGIQSYVIITEGDASIDAHAEYLLFSILWDDGQLGNYAGLGQNRSRIAPLVYNFVATGETELAGYNFWSKKSVKLKLDADEGRHEIEALQLGQHKVRVRKVSD